MWFKYIILRVERNQIVFRLSIEELHVLVDEIMLVLVQLLLATGAGMRVGWEASK